MERFKASVHPDDLDLVQGSLERSLQAGEPVNVEYRIRAGRWPQAVDRVPRALAFFKPTGEPDRVMGVSIDITERKRAEEAFRTSEARLAAGTELAGLGYYEVDFGERTCFVDDRFHDICGVPAGHCSRHPGRGVLDGTCPSRRPPSGCWTSVEKLHDGRVDRISIEYRYLHPTEGQKWIHHLARVAARDATGRGVRTYRGGSRYHHTAEAAEMEAQELRGNLAHAGRVTLLGQLASALAHELSQPLGAILRNAEAAEIMLQSSAPDLEELRAIVKDILQRRRQGGSCDRPAAVIAQAAERGHRSRSNCRA